MSRKIRKIWSAEDVETLKRVFPASTIAEVVAALPGWTWTQCRRKALELGLIQKTHKTTRLVRWSQAEHDIVAAHYPTGMPLDELAALVGRSAKNVVSYAHYKNITRLVRAKHQFNRNGTAVSGLRKDGWSPEHLAILVRDYPAKGARAVGQLLGRSAAAVVQKARKKNLRRQCPNLQPWADEDADLIRELFPAGMQLKALARLLDRTEGAIHSYVKYHGIPRKVRATSRVPAPPRPARVKVVKPRPAPKLRVAVVKAPKPPKPAPVARIIPEKLARKLKLGRRKIAPVAAPVAEQEPQRPKPVKRPPPTPMPGVTAAQIRALKPNDPARHAYNMNGQQGYAEYRRRTGTS